MSAEPSAVLRLGDPRLRRVAEPVLDLDDADFREAGRRLVATLEAFRRANGFGRAMAAPQIGCSLRFLAVELGDGPRLLINPEITWASESRATLWDDCMSFPDLLVRVSRSRSATVRFVDEGGSTVTWERLELAVSELLQHEIDHLDGILAVDRALDGHSLVDRRAFLENPSYFLDQVDYVIPVPAYVRR